MSGVEDVWASMKASDAADLSNYKQKYKGRVEVSHNVGSKKISKRRDSNVKGVQSNLNSNGQLPSYARKESEVTAFKSPIDQSQKGFSIQTSEVSNNFIVVEKNEIRNDIDGKDPLSKIGRYITLINSDVDIDRRNGLNRLAELLLMDHLITEAKYNEIFRDVCKSIFKRFSDNIEKSRELAFIITKHLIEKCSDIGPILSYFIPAIMKRLPSGQEYDEEMKVFVHDRETHEAYRRGKAVDRQDKDGVIAPTIFKIVESSEEIRHLMLHTLFTLIKKIDSLEASIMLHPYFHDIIIFIVSNLRDPHPEIKYTACEFLSYLTQQESYILGMKFYAVGLVRALLPILRHRHSRIRGVAVQAVKFCVMIPDRDKRKGAGTEAIYDIVGFREENVLPVTGFYQIDVQVNYLAELVCDHSVVVREGVVDMLTGFLTTLEDRYDHQTKLIPYLLDLLTDPIETISGAAMRCLKICGKLYEEEHADDIIEKRQYGVDGDNRMNFDKPLPKPFTERPRIGMRLFVRGNTFRFLKALLNELTNWTSQTRMKSANLLKVLIVLCEEHLTMEAYVFLPALVKAINFAKDDKDLVLLGVLQEICELTGRYVVPETFIYYLLPRLKGDVEILQSNADSKYRETLLIILKHMLDGVKPTLIPLHFHEIVTVLSDHYVIDPNSVTLRTESLAVIHVLLASILQVCERKGLVGLETEVFQSTGRLLTQFQQSLKGCFQFLLETLYNPLTRPMTHSSLKLLAAIEKGKIEQGIPSDGSVSTFFFRHGEAMLTSTLDKIEIHEMTLESPEFHILQELIQFPLLLIHRSPRLTGVILHKLCDYIEQSSQLVQTQERFLICLSSLLNEFIIILYTVSKYNKNYEDDSSREDLIAILPVHHYEGIFLEKDFFPPISSSNLLEVQGIIQNNLNNILERFIFHKLWWKSILLQRPRMNLLDTLLKISDKDDHPNHNIHIVETGLSEYGQDDTIVAAQDSIIHSKNLTPQLANLLLRNVIQESTNPASPEDIRSSSVLVIRRIFELLVANQIEMKSVVLKRGQLVSFRRRENLEQGQEKREEVNQEQGVFSMQQSSQAGVQILLSLLNDSNDEIRLTAIRTLAHTLPFLLPGVLPNKEGKEETLDGPVSTAEEINYSIFPFFISRLVKELSLVSAVTPEEYLNELDYLIRKAAVLDPEMVITYLRKMLSEGLVGRGTIMSEKISELLDHCEILLSF